MLGIVLDTNVHVSGTTNIGYSYKLLEMHARGKYKLIISDFILQELKSILSNKKFNLDDDTISKIISRLEQKCEVVTIVSEFDVIKRDPSDNRILSTAYDGKADYIVSGDDHVLDVKEFEGIKIIKPHEMFNILSS